MRIWKPKNWEVDKGGTSKSWEKFWCAENNFQTLDWLLNNIQNINITKNNEWEKIYVNTGFR